MPYAVIRDGQVSVTASPAMESSLRSAGFTFRAWDKTWRAGLTRDTAQTVYMLGLEPSEGAGEFFAVLNQQEPAGTVMSDARAGLLVIKTSRPGVIPEADLASLPGARYEAANDVWTCYAEPVALDTAERHGLDIPRKAREAVEARTARIAASEASASDADVALGRVLRPYQRAGVVHAVTLRRTINDDDMGLGKTIQAISAIETLGHFPALIVCPASLRGNWIREYSRWVPARRVAVLDGHVPDADVIIASYEAMTAHVDELAARGFRAFVADEAHNLKEMSSLRTRAAFRLVNLLPGDALFMYMTGTVMLNRPGELIVPLRMTGTLSDERGARRSVAWFRERFCRGRDNEAELSQFLRSTVMLRRIKTQVLKDLPPKQRTDLWLPLDAGTRALYDQRAAEGLARAMQTKAHSVVYLNRLRQAVGEVKAHEAVRWSLDFMAGTPRPLVIFAFHQHVQQAIISGLRDGGYPVAHILGSQRDVDRHVEDFQAGRARVIVCSITSGGTGHTLTAASDVLTVEQEWRPGIHRQAEDRCHRMGQAHAVNAWYLLADDTIDVWNYQLIEGKADWIDAIADGAAEPGEGSVIDMLMRKQAERYGMPGPLAA